MTIAGTTELICFLALSAVVVIGAVGVVLLSNIVYSAFLLGGVFMAVAGLYLLLNASFVAAAQVLVYVGAINVLILFAIMLVNKREDLKAIDRLNLRRLVSGGVCAALLALLVRVVPPLHGLCPARQRSVRKRPHASANTCSPITCCPSNWLQCCC
jgi:NAD(P)H-quinone oxidoreductase subunit 6